MPRANIKKRARRSRAKKGKSHGVGQHNALAGSNLLAPVSTRSLVPVGFPATWRTQHRYVASLTTTGALGALALYQFRTNSLFDPDLTGTGHQPYGFDQFKTYYATYLVTASRIAVEVTCAAASAMFGVMCSTESSTGLSSADAMTETGRGQGGLLSVNAPPRTFESKWALKEIKHFDPADYSAAVGANPTNSDFYTVYLQDQVFGASPVAAFTVCITYDVEWRDPISITSS